MALDSKITLTQDLSRQTADMDRALATSAELGGMQWGRVGTSESTPTPAVTNAATYIDKASGPRPGYVKCTHPTHPSLTDVDAQT